MNLGGHMWSLHKKVQNVVELSALQTDSRIWQKQIFFDMINSQHIVEHIREECVIKERWENAHKMAERNSLCYWLTMIHFSLPVILMLGAWFSIL